MNLNAICPLHLLPVHLEIVPIPFAEGALGTSPYGEGRTPRKTRRWDWSSDICTGGGGFFFRLDIFCFLHNLFLPLRFLHIDIRYPNVLGVRRAIRVPRHTQRGENG